MGKSAIYSVTIAECDHRKVFIVFTRVYDAAVPCSHLSSKVKSTRKHAGVLARKSCIDFELVTSIDKRSNFDPNTVGVICLINPT